MFNRINDYGEIVRPKYVNLKGYEIKRTPITHPYSYDEFVIYKKDYDENNHNAVYSDRMILWDFDKFEKCCQNVFGNTGQYFNNRTPEDINKFLNLYFGKQTKLTAILEGCNKANGYPYWVFIYEDIK